MMRTGPPELELVVIGTDPRSVATARTGTAQGIASALKRAAIGWAITHGASRMAAENAIGNDVMRGINRALQPAPDFVEMRSPAITT